MNVRSINLTPLFSVHAFYVNSLFYAINNMDSVCYVKNILGTEYVWFGCYYFNFKTIGEHEMRTRKPKNKQHEMNLPLFIKIK